MFGNGCLTCGDKMDRLRIINIGSMYYVEVAGGMGKTGPLSSAQREMIRTESITDLIITVLECVVLRLFKCFFLCG